MAAVAFNIGIAFIYICEKKRNKVHYGRGENGKLPTKQHGTNFISRNFEILLFSSLRLAGRHQVEQSVRRFIGLNDIIVLSRHSYGLAAWFIMLM